MRRVPDFKVVVAFAQQHTSAAAGDAEGSAGATARATLLSECAQRLLWLYHRWLPQSVAEARFDVGKLLQGVHSAVAEAEGSELRGLIRLSNLHVLRLLKESDQFSLSGKS